MRSSIGRVELALFIVIVQAVAAPLGAQANGRVQGVVTDSVHAGPLVDALVTLTHVDTGKGAALSALTDKSGHYEFADVAPGRYAVSFASAFLDSLEFGAMPSLTTVPAGATVTVDLATPSGMTLRAAACPGAHMANFTGALVGTVIDAATQKPLAGATVTVRWAELGIDSATYAMSRRPRVARDSANASGQYRLCGVPTDEELDVRVAHGGAGGPPLRMSIADEEGVIVRNLSLRAAEPVSGDSARVMPSAERVHTGNASIVGQVTRAGGQPIVGAQLRVVNTASIARSDDQGNFVLSGLPSGTQELEVRHLGFGIARHPVQLSSASPVRENVVMERVVALDSVNVVARRIRFPEFERNRLQYPGGTFLDEDEIARRGFKTLPLMVANIPGFHITSMSRGRIGLQSTHLRQCQEVGTERSDPLNLVVDNMEHMEVIDVNFREVAAIEAYPIGEKAPAKYARACSVIVVWTKFIAHRTAGDEARKRGH